MWSSPREYVQGTLSHSGGVALASRPGARDPRAPRGVPRDHHAGPRRSDRRARRRERECQPDLGRRAWAGQPVRPTGRALHRLHDRGGGDRRLWRDRGDPDGRSSAHGGEPRHPANQCDVRRLRESPPRSRPAHIRNSPRRPCGHLPRQLLCLPPSSTSSNLLPSGFEVSRSALSGLTTVNDATVGVALAAGVAGMLALETRASSAVGVAISITTIPAAAYLRRCPWRRRGGQGAGRAGRFGRQCGGAADSRDDHAHRAFRPDGSRYLACVQPDPLVQQKPDS